MLSNLSRFTLFAALTLVTCATLSGAAGTAFAQDDAAAKDSHRPETATDQSPGTANDAATDRLHPEEAHPEEDHAGDPPGTPPLLQFDIGSAVCNIAIFLGVFAILSRFVWPVILGGLKAREDKIHSDLESAEQANKEARGLLADYQAKLDDAAKQVQTMLAEARKDSEASGQRIVEQAKAEGERQRDRAIADIETAKKVALSDLAGQTSDMVISVAKQVVGRELQSADHAELIRQSLERLPSNN